MIFFRFVGFLMILLGIASGIGIFVEPFGLPIEGSQATLWFLFVLVFIGGFILYALGSPNQSKENLIKTCGGILLIIGLMSAMGIFISKMGLIKADGTFSLWLLFLLCIISGAAAIYISEDFEEVIWLRPKEKIEIIINKFEARNAEVINKIENGQKNTHKLLNELISHLRKMNSQS